MEFKKVLVTGAGGDLGAALCRHFARNGVNIVAVNRSREPVEKLQAEIGEAVDFSAYFVDQSDLQSLDHLMPRILSEHADIDLLILNAGIDKPQQLTQFDWRLARQHFDVNVVSNYVILSHFVPHFLSRGRGHVAVVSSLAGYVGFPFEHVYNGSKAAARMMIDGIRIELGGTGIKVTGIYPGFLEGRMAAANAWVVEEVVSLQDAATTIYNGLVDNCRDIHFPQEQADQVDQVLALEPQQRDALIAGMVRMDQSGD